MNIPQQNKDIVIRFFEALKHLKRIRKIRGKQTFTNRYDINRWNLNTQEKEPDRSILQAVWLSYLVLDYGVSAHWLLTGEGEIMQAGNTAEAK
jgi:hypothetical protein